MNWDIVIGLEVHTRLNTRTKLFSSSLNAYGAEPNTQANLVDLGYPGVLPVMNEEAVRLATRLGLAIGAEIDQASRMARKNYFYPDLSKGYQISQDDRPIVNNGSLSISTNDGEKTIRILRAHLEEDAGKSTHSFRPNQSGIDFNRAGTPLLEIVTEPDFCNATEVITYLKKLHHLVRYLGISDANMQEGSFRCDVNISLKPKGSDTLGTRAEIKNINSFRFIEQAIHHETERQAELLESGQSVVQETRLYDADKNETRSMRSKENAHDYRYFPDPDLLPILISQADIDHEKQGMPELPWLRAKRFSESYALSDELIESLLRDRHHADLFESILQENPDLPAKLVANWICVELQAIAQRFNSSLLDSPLNATRITELLSLLHKDTLSSSGAKTIAEALWESTATPSELMSKLNLAQLSNDDDLLSIIKIIINNNPEQAQDFRDGKTKLMAFFVGQVMKASKGSANPKRTTELIRKLLSA